MINITRMRHYTPFEKLVYYTLRSLHGFQSQLNMQALQTDIESQSDTSTTITATNIKRLLPLSTHSNNLKQRYRTNLNKRDKILLLINHNKKSHR